ncbi:hypothetical protein EHQ52_03960 [Leptospira koniambonensis]|uniref:Restriction endonuclease n=1 Tax=Leptospira koniambonensis TaxID=2484950 RepID=A0A4R9JAN4_9LEPT|nr:hypothetical protein [Leptospira koniambonensis]TGL35930.1 hypothetical protein EHQ52_03960 [Leptospira koniambonensis]
MSINDEEIIESLNSFTENEMIDKILIPLYQKRFANKFYEIENTGKNKQEDQGIDITYYELSTDIKNRVYTGIQVKQDDITTGSGQNGIANIINQATQAFSKPVHTVKDKNIYYIKTFKILTTKGILPKARAKIVDQMKDKNIEFIVGSDLIQWVRESFLEEFIKLFPNLGSNEIESDEDLSPFDLIVDYLKQNFEEQIDTVKNSLRPLDGESKNIIFAVVAYRLNNPYEIAKHVGSSKSYIQDCIEGLRSDNLLDYDEDGEIILKTNDFSDIDELIEQAEERIKQLGYEKELNGIEIIERLVIKTRFH